MSRYACVALILAVTWAGFAPAQDADEPAQPAPVKQPAQLPTAKAPSEPKVIEAPREDLNFDIGNYFKISIDTAKKAADFQKTAFIDAKGDLRGVVEVRKPNGDLKPVAGQKLYLLNGPRKIAVTTTMEDGRFVLHADEPGKYQLAGDFDEYIEVALGNAFQEVKFVQNEVRNEDGPVRQPVDEPNPDLVEAEAIGTPPNRNASVFLDDEGNFRFLDKKDRRHHASNDEIFLDANGEFRGVVTLLDGQLRRRPLVGANVYLIQRSTLVTSATTRSNGSFAFANVLPGGYTIVAEFGFHSINNETNGNRNNAPTDAWERDKQGLPWQQSPGQLAIQRIAVRPQEDAVALGPMAEFRKPGAPAIIQVRFQAPADELPILHLSPAPWMANPVAAAVAAPAALAAPGGAGAAAAGGAGGAGAGLAGLAPFAAVAGGGTTPPPATASPAVP